MAYTKIPMPGTKAGPCIEICRHLDCQVNRAVAGHVCRVCHKPIGYGAAYVRDPYRLDGEIHDYPCLLNEATRMAAKERNKVAP